MEMSSGGFPNQTDPTLRSELGESMNLTEVPGEDGKFTDQKGRCWYRVETNRWPEAQMLFSKLMKLAIPVCDIIFKTSPDGTRTYYSLETDPDEISGESQRGLNAAIDFFMWRILKDPDRTRNHNMGKRGHTMKYDFEASAVFCLDQRTKGRTDSFFISRFEAEIRERPYLKIMWDARLKDVNSENLNDLSPESLEHFGQILGRFRQSMRDTDQINAIAELVRVPLKSIMHFPPEMDGKSQQEHLRYLRDVLIERTERALREMEDFEGV